MAKFVIKLVVDDIITSKLGENYLIQADGVDIILTPEALKELLSDYENIKRENTKRIGVVAFNVQDFREFVENIIQTFDIQPQKPPHNYLHPRRVVFDDRIYYRITEAVDLCGHSFDEVIETNSAKDSTEYPKIMENIHLYLNKK